MASRKQFQRILQEIEQEKMMEETIMKVSKFLDFVLLCEIHWNHKYITAVFHINFLYYIRIGPMYKKCKKCDYSNRFYNNSGIKPQ